MKALLCGANVAEATACLESRIARLHAFAPEAIRLEGEMRGYFLGEISIAAAPPIKPRESK